MSSTLKIPGLLSLWENTKGTPDICIAILDGCVDLNHLCFQGAFIEQVPILGKDNVDDFIPSQHGTHVASIIFGQHHTSVLGVAPECRGVIVPIYQSRSDEKRICSQLDLARAIGQAIDYGAHIINISGGELGPNESADPILANAIQRCVQDDILVVAAAGNDGCRCLHVPASISSVLAVGAMDGAGNPAGFSNWGDIYKSNGILALGVDVLGAEVGGNITYASGTSFSAPIVSGVAALLLSLRIKNGLEPKPMEIRKILLETAAPCGHQNEGRCQHYLSGKLDIELALNRFFSASSKGVAASSVGEIFTKPNAIEGAAEKNEISGLLGGAL